MKNLFALLFCTFILTPSAFGQVIPGVMGPDVSFIDGKVMVEMRLLQVELDVGFDFFIPKTHNSSIGITPNSLEGGSLVRLLIDLEDLKKVNVGVGQGNTLPDGRPIPGIPGGELKDSLRLDLDERFYNVSIYYHKLLAGIHIPFHFNLGMFRTVAIPLKWKGKQVGSIAVVKAEGPNKASGTIFLRLNAFKQNKEIQQLLELSRKNPGQVF